MRHPLSTSESNLGYMALLQKIKKLKEKKTKNLKQASKQKHPPKKRSVQESMTKPRLPRKENMKTHNWSHQLLLPKGSWVTIDTWVTHRSPTDLRFKHWAENGRANLVALEKEVKTQQTLAAALQEMGHWSFGWADAKSPATRGTWLVNEFGDSAVYGRNSGWPGPVWKEA